MQTARKALNQLKAIWRVIGQTHGVHQEEKKGHQAKVISL